MRTTGRVPFPNNWSNRMIYSINDRGREKQMLYYRSMGKIFRVTAIAENDEEANQYLSKRDRTMQGVIGTLGDAVVIAEFHGEKIKT